MSQRTKIIILISGAIILFAILVLTIFDLWPGRQVEEPPPTRQEEPDLSFLQEPEEVSGGGKVFDSSNRGEFSQFQGAVFATNPASLEEREVQNLAAFFSNRLGSYSSDSRFAYIDDLVGFMTPRLLAFLNSQKQNQPQGSGYFAVTSEATSLTTASFTNNRAEFDILLNRKETDSSGEEQYNQNVKLNLIKGLSGDWKVDGVFWGERL